MHDIKCIEALKKSVSPQCGIPGVGLIYSVMLNLSRTELIIVLSS